MNGQPEQSGIGFGWIVLLVILYIICNPIPGPIDDAAVSAVGGYHALKGCSAFSWWMPFRRLF